MAIAPHLRRYLTVSAAKRILAAASFGRKAPMAVDNLAEAINSLKPEEQECVWQFVEFLKPKGEPAQSPFLAAVDELIEQHPELLRRLAH